MTIKKIIQFNFTEEERELLDIFSGFLNGLDSVEYQTVLEVTKGLNIVDAVEKLCSLAFYNNVYELKHEKDS